MKELEQSSHGVRLAITHNVKFISNMECATRIAGLRDNEREGRRFINIFKKTLKLHFLVIKHGKEKKKKKKKKKKINLNLRVRVNAHKYIRTDKQIYVFRNMRHGGGGGRIPAMETKE